MGNKCCTPEDPRERGQSIIMNKKPQKKSIRKLDTAQSQSQPDMKKSLISSYDLGNLKYEEFTISNTKEEYNNYEEVRTETLVSDRNCSIEQERRRTSKKSLQTGNNSLIVNLRSSELINRTILQQNDNGVPYFFDHDIEEDHFNSFSEGNEQINSTLNIMEQIQSQSSSKDEKYINSIIDKNQIINGIYMEIGQNDQELLSKRVDSTYLKKRKHKKSISIDDKYLIQLNYSPEPSPNNMKQIKFGQSVQNSVNQKLNYQEVVQLSNNRAQNIFQPNNKMRQKCEHLHNLYMNNYKKQHECSNQKCLKLINENEKCLACNLCNIHFCKDCWYTVKLMPNNRYSQQYNENSQMEENHLESQQIVSDIDKELDAEDSEDNLLSSGPVSIEITTDFEQQISPRIQSPSYLEAQLHSKRDIFTEKIDQTQSQIGSNRMLGRNLFPNLNSLNQKDNSLQVYNISQRSCISLPKLDLAQVVPEISSSKKEIDQLKKINKQCSSQLLNLNVQGAILSDQQKIQLDREYFSLSEHDSSLKSDNVEQIEQISDLFAQRLKNFKQDLAKQKRKSTFKRNHSQRNMETHQINNFKRSMQVKSQDGGFFKKSSRDNSNYSSNSSKRQLTAKQIFYKYKTTVSPGHINNIENQSHSKVGKQIHRKNLELSGSALQSSESREGSLQRTDESPLNNYIQNKLKSPLNKVFSPGLESSGKKSTPFASHQLKFKQNSKKDLINDMRKSMTLAELEKLDIQSNLSENTSQKSFKNHLAKQKKRSQNQQTTQPQKKKEFDFKNAVSKKSLIPQKMEQIKQKYSFVEMLNTQLTNETPYKEVKIVNCNDSDQFDNNSSSSFKDSDQLEEAETMQCPSCNKTFEGNLNWIMEKHLPNCIKKLESSKKQQNQSSLLQNKIEARKKALMDKQIS